jgi:hypothetical protein
MKAIILSAVLVLSLTGCATTAPVTAWGKANVSKVDYGTDVGMCTGLASLESSGNGANTAGGMSGQRASGPSSTNAGGSLGTLGGGTYTGTASPDLVNRAATQQQSQAMAAKRLRDESMGRCMGERGYQQIRLTPEQNAELHKYKNGSDEYHEYLYKLGADPSVISKQGVGAPPKAAATPAGS